MTDRSTIQQTDMMGHGEVTLPVQCVHPNTYIRYLFLHSPEKKLLQSVKEKFCCLVLLSAQQNTHAGRNT